MQVHELACSPLSLHEVPCIYMSLYAVPFFVWAAHKNFAVLVQKEVSWRMIFTDYQRRTLALVRMGPSPSWSTPPSTSWTTAPSSAGRPTTWASSWSPAPSTSSLQVRPGIVKGSLNYLSLIQLISWGKMSLLEVVPTIRGSHSH